jgi:hypothetical protein
VADIIVEPFFKDAFRINPSTPEYSALLDTVPPAFVGSASSLKRIVAILASHMSRAYVQQVSGWVSE